MEFLNSNNNRKYLYIVKWPDEVERYLFHDKKTDDYLKVDLAEAQPFDSKDEAENVAKMLVELYGTTQPIIVPVQIM